jgi:lipoprotein
MIHIRKNFNLIVICSIFLISCDYRNKKIIKEAETIIQKIEKYKSEKGKIPPNLVYIGIEETEEGPIYYVPWKDSINYIIYFSEAGVGESLKYYSDTRMWEKIDRGIEKTTDTIYYKNPHNKTIK